MPLVFSASLLAAVIAAVVAPALHRRLGDRVGPLLALVPLAAFVGLLAAAPALPTGGVAFALPWAPSLDLALALRVDGLALLFLLLVTFIGAAVVVHAAGYLRGSPTLGRFYLHLFAFMAAMLGVFAADHLLALYVFWELTSVTSYLLIGHQHGDEEARASARTALLVTSGGGLAMLAGFVLLARAGGTHLVSELASLPAGALVDHPLTTPALVLILIGAFTKSAQFPVHFWLPGAMVAPAPVSAFLHSATMVNAGVYLLARLAPHLGAHPLWAAILLPVGAATALVGVGLGLAQRDLKRLLAGATIAVLGLLVLLVGVGTPAAILAALAYLVAHALYKAALFLVAGTVRHQTGARDLERLGGLGRAMPRAAAGSALAALSMAGIPPLLGFVSKEALYEALLEVDVGAAAAVIFGVVVGAGLVALSVIAGLRPWLGAPRPTPKAPEEGPWTLWAGPLVLGAAALGLGLAPGWASRALLLPAARGVLGGDAAAPEPLALWHGVTPPLLLGLLTLAAGAGLTALAPRIRGAHTLRSAISRVSAQRAYEGLLAALQALAELQTRLLQSGSLRAYIHVVFGAAVVLLGLLLPVDALAIDLREMAPPTVLGVGVCLLMIAATIAACVLSTRFAAILSLGIVGLGVAVLFFHFSAPDLAMTQILVETLTVILFVLALGKLPPLRPHSRRIVRLRDAALCLVFGAVMSALTLLAVHFPRIGWPVSEGIAAASAPLAHGHNVVNTILVDFRALDTLGEITVLASAALGVVAMLCLGPARAREEEP